MKKRTRTVLRILASLIAGFTVVSILLFLWLSRSPTTQLIDASGSRLTAGFAHDQVDEVIDDSLFVEAQALIKSKKFALAKENLLQIIEESDRDGEACVLLSDVSCNLREAEAAVDFGLKAVKLLPNSAEAHLSYAKALGLQMYTDMQSISGMFSALTHLGHFKEALSRVIELNPDDTEARTMSVLCNMAPKPFGNIEAAIEVSQEIELRDPVGGKQLLAACYHRKKETERAISLLLDGIEEYPAERSFRVALADIYAEEKRFDAADREYQLARQGEKDETYYRSLYGQARMRILNEFDPVRAIELLDEYIAGEPDGDNMQSAAHASWRKGNALEQLGRHQDAREAYKESLRREPGLKLAKNAIENLQD